MRKVDSKRKAWSILVQTEGGTVSLIPNLTLHEALAMHASLDPWGGPAATGVRTRSRIINDSDVKLRQIIGPEGWTP